MLEMTTGKEWHADKNQAYGPNLLLSNKWRALLLLIIIVAGGAGGVGDCSGGSCASGL
jgi:hypothetical protein